MQQKNNFAIEALHVFVLFSFALAQPLFDLLSKNAEFFVARHSAPIDVIFLTLILCVLLPTLVVLIEMVAGIFGRRPRRVVHAIVVASRAAVIALPVLNQIEGVHGTVLVVGAAVLGVTATISYIYFHPVRMFMTILSPALLIFPGLFLFNSPVSKVVFPKSNSVALASKVDANVPIIMVLFYEWPVT